MTNIKENMTTKTTKTILFASLIVAMILPFGVMDFVDAEKNNLRADMKAIHDKIKDFTGAEKQQLTSEYIQKNNQYNKDNYKAPDRDFVGEWKTLDTVQLNLAEQRYVANEELKTLTNPDEISAKQSEIADKDSEIRNILREIRSLERESINSMKMDSETELRFKQIVSDLHTTYGDENPDNAFVMAGINYEQKKLLVELTTQFDDAVDPEMSSVVLAETIRSSIGENDVIISFDSLKPVTCTDYTTTCTPDRVGGVALYRSDDAENLAGSIGYKATYNEDVGYITAGHSVDPDETGNWGMKQTSTQISSGFGYPFTTSTLAGDYSFQKTSSSVIDDIYFSSSLKADIEDYAIADDHEAGVYMYKMGAGEGLDYGSIQNSWGAGTWEIDAATASGDSGGPTFQIVGYENGQYIAKVFGHVTNADTTHTPWHAVYQPVHKIVAAGIVPSVD